MLSLDKNRWDIWSLPARVTASCINEDNELMICAESSNVVGQNANGESIDSEGAVITNPFSLYEMHKGSSKEPLSWTSKSLVFGEDGRDKKVKTIRLVGRDVVLESMIVDGTEITVTYYGLVEILQSIIMAYLGTKPSLTTRL